ncbi:MAG TPA: hypothetical protein VMT17_07320 [Anaeromyxobacteraceae bacterium]|nr:hypothetical protein [Anaeromyxobacteraceae bacterium]
MRRWTLAVLVAALVASPAVARAGLVDVFVDFSGAVPWQMTPAISRLPTNVMITPGVLFVGWVSAELGIEASVAQFSEPARWGIRPMVGVYPPFMPLYAKLVVDVGNLNLAGGLPVVTTVGGALGLKFDVIGFIRVFVEGDYLPATVRGTNLNVVEARIGIGARF